MQNIKLQRGKEVPVRNKHHWIFSGAIERIPKDIENGDIVKVMDFHGQVLGHAFINKDVTIAGRMINFSNEDPIKTLAKYIKDAKNLREEIIDESVTDSYRVINSEGDKISGLTVDKYGDALVIQIATLGLEKIKDRLIKILVEEFDPNIIFEKSNMPARRVEGLENFEDIVYQKKQGEISTTIQIKENDNKFEIDFKNSHKTGFYLDQREMRKFIGDLSKNRSLLNCFSYTGGFSVYAAKNGAKNVASLDISKEVIEQAKQNFKLNNIDPEKHEFYAMDVFKFIESNDIAKYDIVILDPPAFAKKKQDIPAAKSGYRRLNRAFLKKMKKGSFLLTCSCSYHMDEETFLGIIKESAASSNREIRILEKHRHAPDHPINLFHKENDYLKSFLLWVE